jgi:aspartyl/asparaginyl-tRNA synthetase
VAFLFAVVVHFYDIIKYHKKILTQIVFLVLSYHFIVIQIISHKQKKIKMQTVKEIAKGVAIVALGIIAAQQLQKALKLS